MRSLSTSRELCSHGSQTDRHYRHAGLSYPVGGLLFKLDFYRWPGNSSSSGNKEPCKMPKDGLGITTCFQVTPETILLVTSLGLTSDWQVGTHLRESPSVLPLNPVPFSPSVFNSVLRVPPPHPDLPRRICAAPAEPSAHQLHSQHLPWVSLAISSVAGSVALSVAASAVARSRAGSVLLLGISGQVAAAVMLMTLSSAVSPVTGAEVTGTTKPVAVPSLSGSESGTAQSVAVPPVLVSGLIMPAVAKSIAVPSLVPRAENSVPVSSLDVTAVTLIAKLCLLVAIVAKRLAVPGLVFRVTKSRAIVGPLVGVAL